MHRFYWRVTRVLMDYRPYRPLRFWWRVTRSRRVWRFRWPLTALQYRLRHVTAEQLEQSLRDARDAMQKANESERSLYSSRKRRK